MTKKMMCYVWSLFFLASCGQTDLSLVPEESLITPEVLWTKQDSTKMRQCIAQQLEELAITVNEGELLAGKINREERFLLKSSAEYTYDIIVMGDCELYARGVTYNELYNKIGKIAGIGTTYTGLRYDDGTIVGKPELAFVAGDLTGDRASSSAWNNVNQILNQLNNKGIFVFANVGNHDWEPRQWDDGSYGYTYEGHQSNIRSIVGVLNIYISAIRAVLYNGRAAYFSNLDSPLYMSKSSISWWNMNINMATAAPVYGFTYKGVDYVVAPRFLFDPEGDVTFSSFFGYGPARFSKGLCESYLSERSRKVNANKRIYIQHYPYNCSDTWWNDYYSGRSASTLRSNYISAMKSANVSAIFSGHNHSWSQNALSTFTDYTSGYTGNAGGPACFLMVRVSSTRGVVYVKSFNTNMF